jgi:hypothetical protein
MASSSLAFCFGLGLGFAFGFSLDFSLGFSLGSPSSAPAFFFFLGGEESGSDALPFPLSFSFSFAFGVGFAFLAVSLTSEPSSESSPLEGEPPSLDDAWKSSSRQNR